MDKNRMQVGPTGNETIIVWVQEEYQYASTALAIVSIVLIVCSVLCVASCICRWIPTCRR